MKCVCNNFFFRSHVVYSNPTIVSHWNQLFLLHDSDTSNTLWFTKKEKKIRFQCFIHIISNTHINNRCGDYKHTNSTFINIRKIQVKLSNEFFGCFNPLSFFSELLPIRWFFRHPQSIVSVFMFFLFLIWHVCYSLRDTKNCLRVKLMIRLHSDNKLNGSKNCLNLKIFFKRGFSIRVLNKLL